MQRFTISLDDELADEFERYMHRAGYANRSEAIRDMLYIRLGQQREQADHQGDCMAVLSYVYDHHARDLTERLARLQHARHQLTISTTHVHVDPLQCLETVLLRGPAGEVRALANAIMAERGVHHGQLNVVMGQGAQGHSHEASHGGSHGHAHDHPHEHSHDYSR